MGFILTRKDVISLNQRFEDGTINNIGSLEYSLSYAKKTENWTKALAYLTRAILIDHVFSDGNKRTTALLIKSYATYEGHQVINSRLVRIIKNVILKNITSIKKIEEMIKDVIK